MIAPAAALVLAFSAAAVTPSELEASAREQVAAEFERVGRRTPVTDEALSEAARRLARLALEENARSATDLVTSTEAVSQAGAWDPSPRILVIKGSPATEPLRMLKQRKDLAADSATHVGIGAAIDGNGSAIALLVVQRKIRLDKFVRAHPAPVSPRELCGSLEPPLGAPEIVVTRPDGKVDRATYSKLSSQRFCARVALSEVGRYTVEVLGKGPRGPEVAALFFVDVGGPAARRSDPLTEEPKDPATARALIVERINGLRAAHGQKPLTLDPEVTKVAQAYSEQMAKERFFAHVAPDGSSVGQRLRAAGYPFKGAGENLGMAPGPMAAHFGIEHSPGHRKNLLEPGWQRVGIGIAEQPVEGGVQVIVTQVFVDPLTTSADPVADAYRVINQKRAELKLPPLERNAVLEGLAADHARRALRQDEPKAELDGSKLHERVFEALDEVKSASVDFFVADNPALIEASKAAANAAHSLVGIGTVKGHSAKYGRDKYWVVVIYAARR